MQSLRLAQFLALGYAQFGSRGYLANARDFTPSALSVDLSDRHYVVTGATSGLGRVTAEALAARGAHVHLLCRDAARGERARAAIARDTGNANVTLHKCDVSSLADVARFAADWAAAPRPIAALVNNAGTMIHRVERSSEGLEMGFATNTLGPFALAEMLRPSLHGGRVVTVSSAGMLTQHLEVKDLEGKALTNGDVIDGPSQYSRCKRRQVAMTESLARHDSNGVFWASVHPGWAGTPGLEKAMPDFFRFTKNQLRSEEQGADGIIYLAISDEALTYPSGEFFFDRRPAVKHLWFAGTQYPDEQADALVNRLRDIIREKGYDLPK